jgi:hypothetical protein
LAEECSELSSSILQYLTKNNSEIDIQNEMGDVEIAIDILKIIYSNKNIELAKESKYKKIDKKLREIIKVKNANS